VTVLAVDQGTSGTKAVVVDDEGQVLAIAEEPVRPTYLAGGGVEQDPGQLLASVLDAGRRAVAEAGESLSAPLCKTARSSPTDGCPGQRHRDGYFASRPRCLPALIAPAVMSSSVWPTPRTSPCRHHPVSHWHSAARRPHTQII
jgi:FGGY family of carbohydrate kinases, N-terminal domain